MQCARSHEAIQELIDGTLGPIRKAELQQHLDECAGCRALADDLQRVHDMTESLDTPQPGDHVWIQLAGRLRQEGRVADGPMVIASPRTQYAWLAIAASLLLAVGASLWMIVPSFRTGTPATQEASGNADGGATVESGVEDLRQAEKLLQSGLTKLKDGLGSDQAALPPDAARAIDRNLEILDQAIAESTAAVRQEPQSVAARNSLFDALQRKISVLQDTIALMNEMRKGNAAGAAQVVEGMKKS